ncbi:DUF4266 domain-containing protein [Methylomonas sp. SURF-2]|uniref:DUF4266 domain-containing protein n=1 Tax=Methylomonas subterranea TaxID=2952225 RepID=A0ABT1TES6_9GAMM|nr:DUF4266 domain-containing protein [Methylomonas sp. SURF-2]MCQ8103960.1 DUF4266 domain-containing protein [Methylomonas sp. SURF-2]
MINLKRAVGVFSIALALQLLGGCAVAPWERGTLAKPQMALEPYPLQTELRGHNYGAREAATGSSSGSGGGCGCY